jgi:hypothetical protein
LLGAECCGGGKQQSSSEDSAASHSKAEKIRRSEKKSNCIRSFDQQVPCPFELKLLQRLR